MAESALHSNGLSSSQEHAQHRRLNGIESEKRCDNDENTDKLDTVQNVFFAFCAINNSSSLSALCRKAAAVLLVIAPACWWSSVRLWLRMAVYRPNRFLRHVLHSNTTRPFTFSSCSRFFSAALGAARSLDGTRPRLRCLTESAKESQQHDDNPYTREIHPMMLLFSLAATCPGQIAASSQLHAGKISNTERSKTRTF